MSTIKRVVDNDYLIETQDAAGNVANDVVFTTENVRINGNLTVTGTTTEVGTTDLVVTDNTITLNDGESGTGITAGTAGISVDRGLANDVGLRYNETSDTWQLTNDGTTWSNILAAGSGSLNIVEDTTPQLGGALDVNGFAIVTATGSDADIVLQAAGDGRVVIEKSELALDKRLDDPESESGYNLIYYKDRESGGTGIFFKLVETEGELISASKALVYSIIF